MTNDLPPLRPAHVRRRRSGPFSALRASFFTGLIVIAPIGITIWLIWALTGWMDSWVLPLIPPRWRPENYIGINLRGIGVVVFLIFTLLIGSIARIWIGRALIRALSETKIPYVSITPTFSVCKDHGYLTGEQITCPNCGQETEVYTRVVGYYRPVKMWNRGKQAEYKDRVEYSQASCFGQ